MPLTEILKALGLDDNADEAKALDAIKALQPAEGSVTLDKSEVATLLADAAAGRAAAEELRQTKFTTAFDTAMGEGKVTDGQRETFHKLFEADSDSALKVLSELKPAINMAPAGTGGTPSDLGDMGRALAGEFSDSITPLGIDQEALRLHSAAEAIALAKNIDYAEALKLAEAGVTV